MDGICKVKVSVIMPCLNSAEYIGEAIESVLNQTLEEIELLIVDAGSYDGTLEIIKDYQKKDKRIVLWHSEKKSMGHQYNVGIQNAKGKYVGFVESDDYIDVHMLEKMFDIAEQEHLDFVKSDFDMFIDSKDGRLLLNYSIPSARGKEVYDKVICPANYPEFISRDVNMWNGIYDRSFLLDNQVFLNTTDGAAFQDTGFVLKSFVNAKRIMYMNIPSYYYRKDNMNASTFNKSKHIQFIMDEYMGIWDYMKERKIQQPFRAAIFKRCFDMFCGSFDYAKFHGILNDRVQEKIERFMLHLSDGFDELSYFEKRENELDASLSLSLLENMEEFEKTRRFIDTSTRNVWIHFFDAIKMRQLIIFGAGENGAALYAFLKKNKVEKVHCFCDNDKKKAGTKLMGKDCILPEMLQERFGEILSEILFVVTVEAYFSDICRQLEKLGIHRENIIRNVMIPSYSAFEIEMENYRNE